MKISLKWLRGAYWQKLALALLLPFFVLITVIAYQASTPAQASSETLNFQGRLLTSTGGLVSDGTYNIEFNIYNVASGGSTLWTEDRLNTNTEGVTVRNGYFSVYLGELDAFGGLDWNQDLWLGMTIRGTGSCAWGACTPADSEMTPRFELSSVPYAVQASRLATNTGSFTSTLDFTTPTANRTISLPDDDGTVCLTSGNCAGVGGTGDIVDGGQAGSISIGTTDATTLSLLQNGSAALTVNTSQLLQFNAYNCSTFSNGGTLTTDASGNVICANDDGGGGGSGVDTIGALDGGTANANGASIVSTTLYLQSASATFPGLINTTAQTLAGNKTFTGNTLFQSAVDSTTALQVLDNDGGNPVFSVDTVNERVGIGTTSPNEALEVLGNIQLSNNFWIGRSNTSNIEFNSNGVEVNPGAGNNLTVTEQFVVDDLGSALDASLGGVILNDAGSTSKDFRVEGGTNANLLFVDASTDRVGIGTAAPGYQFEIRDASNNLSLAVQNDILYVGDQGSSGLSGQINLYRSQIISPSTGGGNLEILRNDTCAGGGACGIDLNSQGSGARLVLRGSNTIEDIQIYTAGSQIADFTQAGNFRLLSEGTATVGTQYNSQDFVLQGSVWDTTNTAAEDRQISLRVTAGSGADGSEPYRLGVLNNAGTEFVTFDGLNQSVGIGQGSINQYTKTQINSVSQISGTKTALKIVQSGNCCSGGIRDYFGVDSTVTTSDADGNKYAFYGTTSGAGVAYGAYLNASSTTAGDNSYGLYVSSSVTGGGGAIAYGIYSNSGINFFSGNSIFNSLATFDSNLRISDGSSNYGTIAVQSTAGDYTFTIPTTTANDTFCLATLGNCLATGSAGGALTGAYPNPTLANLTTSGAVPFVSGSSGVLTQDAANFYWNDTTNRLGIGTASPQAILTLQEENPLIRFNVGNVSSYVGGLNIYSDAGTLERAFIGYNNGVQVSSLIGNTSISAPGGSNIVLNLSGSSANPTFYIGGSDLVYEDNNIDQFKISRTRTYVRGNLGVGLEAPNAKLEVLSASEQLRLSYDDSNYSNFTTDSSGNLVLDSSLNGFQFSVGGNSSGGDQTLKIDSGLNGSSTLFLESDGGSGDASYIQFGLDGATNFTRLRYDGSLALAQDYTIDIPEANGTLAISASGNIALSSAGNISFTGTLGATSGGTGQSTTTIGDILVGAAGNTFNRLAIGGSNTCLISNGTTAAWGSCTAGGGGFTNLTLTADSGTNQTVDDTETIDIAGGTNINTVVGPTNTVTVNLNNAPTITGLLTLSSAGTGLSVTNNATIGGTLTTTGLATFNGNLRISDGSGNWGTIAVASTAGDYTYTIPTTTANDTFCLVGLNNCTGAGATSVGALDGGTLNANGAFISAGTLYLQSASATWPGLVTTGTQTIAGAKTFNSLITGQAGLAVTGADINLNVSSNFDTNINTGTSTGAVNIGSTTSGATTIRSGPLTTIRLLANGQSDGLTLSSSTVIVDSGFLIPGAGNDLNLTSLGRPVTTDSINIYTGPTSGASATSGDISITTGDGNGASADSGDILIDTGTANGTRGLISIGATNASSVLLASAGSNVNVEGNLRISDGSSNYATIDVDALAGNYSVSIPTITANDEFCLLVLGNCAGSGTDDTTITVAPDDASAGVKAAADYVADGTSDQTEINSALTAAAGGKVTLLAGTFVADGTILVPNNTTLAGVGPGTVIELDDIDVTDNLIENSDTTTGTGVVIRDLKLDGRDDLNTSGTQYGISFVGMGSGTGVSARQGGVITNVIVEEFRNRGISITGSENNYITDNSVLGIGSVAILLNTSNNNIVSGNITQGSLYGIFVDATSSYNTVNANTVKGNSTWGIVLATNSNYNSITSNLVYDNGGATSNNGIYVDNADFNDIIGNTITDTACTTNCYAINIFNVAAGRNYLESNRYTGSATDAATINDAGTNTIFAGQQTNSATSTNNDVTDFRFRGSANSTTAFAVQNAAGTSVLNVDTTTGLTSFAGNGVFYGALLEVGNPTQSGSLALNDGSSNYGTIAVAPTAGNYTYTIPTTTGNDTFCLLTANNCSGNGAFLTSAGLTRLSTITDNVTIGSTASGGKLFVDGDSDEVQLQIQGNSTQNADLLVLEDSIGTVLSGFTNSGNLKIVETLTTTSGGVRIGTDATGCNTFLRVACLIGSSSGGQIYLAGGSGGSNVLTISQNGTNNDAVISGTLGIDIGTGSTTRLAISNTGNAVYTGGTTGDALVVNNSTSTGNILGLQDNGVDVLTVADGGLLTVTSLATFNGNLRITDGSGNYATIDVDALAEDYSVSIPTITADDEFCLLVLGNCVGAGTDDTTITVAPNDASAGVKAAADYVADGTSDETEINSALTAAVGGKVTLLAGTFVADGTILVPNNTTLEGEGPGTIIELADIDIADNLIENSDTTTGTGVTIRDLRLNGRDDLNTLSSQRGIVFNGMGSTTRKGGQILDIISEDFHSFRIYLTNSSNNVVSGTTTRSTSGSTSLLISSSSTNNTLINNSVYNTTAGTGINIQGSGNSAVGNSINSGVLSLYITGDNNTITGNNVTDSNNQAYTIFGGNNNTVTGNTAKGAQSKGIIITSSANNNLVSGNNLVDIGGATVNDAIYVTGSDYNTISNNKITDSACTSNCYAINIVDSTSDKNYLSGNRYIGSASNAASINDSGTGTIYEGQQTNSTTSTNSDVTDFRFRGSADSTSAFTVQNAAGRSVFNVDTTNGYLTVRNVANTGEALTISDQDNTGVASDITFRGAGLLSSEDDFLINIDSNNNNTNRAFTIAKDSATVGGSYTALFQVFENGSITVNDSGQSTADLRVESDTDPNAFFFDASTGKVSIGGGSSPTYRLQVEGEGCCGGTGGLLKIRNSLDSGYSSIDFYNDSNTLGLLTFGYANDTVIIPELRGSAYLSTGSGTDFILRTNSTQRALFQATGGLVLNEPGNDYDFRVEGNTDSNLLVVDASADSIGIGTSTPDAQLEVVSTTAAEPRGVLSSQYSNNVNGAFFQGRKARGAQGTPSAITDGDFGTILANSFYDGNSWENTGFATFKSNGTVADGSVPTDFVLYTGSTAWGSERLRVTSVGNLGLGISDPDELLEVKGSGTGSTRIGAPAGCGGAGNWGGIGFAAFDVGCTNYNIIGGDGNLWINRDSGGEIYFREDGSNNGATHQLTIASGGNIGIADNIPAYKLEVGGGDINTTGGGYRDAGTCVAGTCASDINLKNNVATISGALQKVTSLNPVSYYFNDSIYGQGQQYGLIAQEVQSVFPELVSTDPETGYKQVSYGLQLQFYTMAALKELNVQVQSNTSALASLNSTTNSLTKKNLTVTNQTTTSKLSVTGTATIVNLKVTGLTELADLKVNGKIITAGNVPTAVLGASTTGQGSIYVLEGNDTAGSLTITTGINTVLNPITAGEQIVITFDDAYATTPRIALTAKDSNSAGVRTFVETTVDGFIVNFLETPAEETTYTFDYIVIQ